VSIIGLSDYDDFRHIETDYCLVGRRTGKAFRMGDKLLIKVVAANLEKRQLDYEWISQPDSDSEVTIKPKKQRSGKGRS